MRTKTSLLSAAIVASLAMLHVQSTASSGKLPGQNAPSAPIAAAGLSGSTAYAGMLSAVGSSPSSADAMVAYTRSGAAADRTPQAERARALLAGPAASRAHRADADAFVANDVIVDRDGTEHVRMQRTYAGLPVVGGDLVVHSRDGQVLGISQTLRSDARPNLQARISGDAAITAAGADFGTGFDGVSDATRVIYARDTAPTLAYQVVFNGTRADQTPTEMHYIVDAGNGRVLDKWDIVYTAKPGGGGGGGTGTNATGTAKTLFSGNVSIVTNSVSGSFTMVDNSRGGNAVNNMANRTSGSGTLFSDADNVWGNNTTSDSATVAGDAMYGVGKTWDYYKNVHGRNGIANDGRGALSKVHYGRNYVNAFWSDSTFSMSYGDGNGSSYYPLVNIDVAGHEMSHGVTSRSANLTYSGESGGLNEATSDIFGTMVEFYANNANDTPDYLIGEEIYVSNPNGTKALRYMFKPNIDGSSPDCYSGSLGSLDVHYSSGVANHFFYLLAEGATVPAGFGSGTSYNLSPSSLVCNGNTAAGGIGRDAAQKIWYRALTVYMTSSTNYAGARAATLSAAADLYGSGSANYNAVATTWSAVGVN